MTGKVDISLHYILFSHKVQAVVFSTTKSILGKKWINVKVGALDINISNKNKKFMEESTGQKYIILVEAANFVKTEIISAVSLLLKL